jgi:short-subunit dehydrogenase
MVKGKHSERVGSSVKYAVGPEVVAKDTLKGLLKRKREVITPGIYKLFISMYHTLPGVVEKRIRKALRPTSQVMADAAKRSN